MSLYNLTNATTPDGVLIGLASSVPAFPIMLLLFTWFLVFLGGSLKQNSRYGYADIPQWSVLASMSILLLGLIMTISAGLIPMSVLGIIVSINILTGIWFFMSRGRVE
jgi:hypothetical protein